ncbi:hypothetical protein [Cupriavidus respiraculi]|uniref:hypothetical protein n=1 Tax=Cupriavidus respiraculi TaxID=195930 RepID=UPI001CC4CB84|nr:hypothetical protein [Cupriavidus respiraculi]
MAYLDQILGRRQQPRRQHVTYGKEDLLTFHIDRPSVRPHHSSMDPVSRPELEAKLEAIEARMDARAARIEGKIDAFLAQIAERDKRFETSLADRDARIALIAQQAADSASRADDAAQKATGIKLHFWASVGAQVAAVIAICVGAYYANQQSVIGIGQLLQGQQAGATSPPTSK